MSDEPDILDNVYYTDPATETLAFFEKKGITKEQLAEWKKQHPIVYPWTVEYETLRQDYNRRWQYYPLAIVMAKKVKDVRWALQLARTLEVQFSIRAGGHDWNGLSLSAGIVIDVSRRDYVHVKGSIVTVGAGIHIGPLVKALEKYALVVPSGTCQNVGLAGSTLGGGLGFLTRHYGLTLDSLLEVRLLLADGSLVVANKDEKADLFWALRGGGPGNLGIVTDMTFKAHRLSHVYLFQVWIPRYNFRKLFKWWQQWAPNTDIKLTSEVDLYPRETLSDERPEQVLLTGEYSCSQLGEGEKNKQCKDKEQLRTILQPAIQLSTSYKIWRVSCTDAVRHFSSPNPNYFFQNRSAFFNRPLDGTGIGIIESYIDSAKEGMGLEINAMGGVFSKPSVNSTAFPWRDSIFWIEFRSGWRDPHLSEEHIAWVQGLYEQLRPYYSTRCIPMLYYNFADLSLGKEYPLAYWGTNAKRLIEVKTKYDPDNVFSRPQGIPVIHVEETT
jgi:hypothetical protein